MIESQSVDIGNATLQSIRVKNPGIGYTTVPTVTVADPNIITGRGNFELTINDIVVGMESFAANELRNGMQILKVLKISMLVLDQQFQDLIPVKK